MKPMGRTSKTVLNSAGNLERVATAEQTVCQGRRDPAAPVDEEVEGRFMMSRWNVGAICSMLVPLYFQSGYAGLSQLNRRWQYSPPHMTTISLTSTSGQGCTLYSTVRWLGSTKIRTSRLLPPNI